MYCPCHARLLRCLLVLLLSTTAAAVQRKEAAIASGWVKPAAGATTAEAYLVIVNPTAYDVVLQKPSSDAAGVVELRAAGKTEPLDFVTVPAYESLEMSATGTYLILRDVKKPLTDGARVPISVMTDRGSPLTVEAVVKNQ